MEFDPIFDKLFSVDAHHYEPNSYTMFIFVEDRLYMVYWSDMNEEYSIICHDPGEWLSDDFCSYDTFYAQTETEVIESINDDLIVHKKKPLRFIKGEKGNTSIDKRINGIMQNINDEMMEWDIGSDFNRGVVEGLGIALGFVVDIEEK